MANASTVRAAAPGSERVLMSSAIAGHSASDARSNGTASAWLSIATLLVSTTNTTPCCGRHPAAAL